MMGKAHLCERHCIRKGPLPDSREEGLIVLRVMLCL